MKHVFLLIALFVLTPQAVVNRLAAGWSEWRVLDAYYAPDAPATEEQVHRVAAVLDGREACSPDLYFMWSAADIAYLHYGDYEPALVVQNGSQKVLFYSRRFRQEQEP